MDDDDDVDLDPRGLFSPPAPPPPPPPSGATGVTLVDPPAVNEGGAATATTTMTGRGRRTVGMEMEYASPPPGVRTSERAETFPEADPMVLAGDEAMALAEHGEGMDDDDDVDLNPRGLFSPPAPTPPPPPSGATGVTMVGLGDDALVLDCRAGSDAERGRRKVVGDITALEVPGAAAKAKGAGKKIGRPAIASWNDEILSNPDCTPDIMGRYVHCNICNKELAMKRPFEEFNWISHLSNNKHVSNKAARENNIRLQMKQNGDTR
jgi:hypothetical protein